MAKRRAIAEELETRAESKGYKRETHPEKDSTRDNGKHNKKAKRNQGISVSRLVRISILTCSILDRSERT
jgi:hypothetical protein